jgi:predicted nucleic acid-binding protein
MEFWSVATRPSVANGLGLTPEQTAKEINQIESLFPVLDDVPTLYRRWRHLVETCGVSGRQAFDARIAALMLSHHLFHILTFNTDDFRRYPGLVVVSFYEVIGIATSES